MFIASDIPAILEHTRQHGLPGKPPDGPRHAATASPVTDLDGEPVNAEIHHIAWDPVSAAKGEYKHFMQKEIFEQPRALIDTLRRPGRF